MSVLWQVSESEGKASEPEATIIEIYAEYGPPAEALARYETAASSSTVSSSR